MRIFRKLGVALTASLLAILITSARATAAQVDISAVQEAICWLIYFEQGSYGALLVAVSGVGAIAQAAMGSYRGAMNCLVVCLGIWLMTPVAELMYSYNVGGKVINPVPSVDCCRERMGGNIDPQAPECLNGGPVPVGIGN